MPTINKQTTSLTQQTNEQTKVIQEAVSPEVSKLNHAAMNKKTRRSNAVFSRKKTRKKENGFIPPIIPVDGLCYKIR